MNTQGPYIAPYKIRQVEWRLGEAAISMLRRQVFIIEQSVPEELEWDGEDEAALHLLAEDEVGNPIGTARMLADGHIGRVAVLAPWRGRGVGMTLMLRMLELARKQGHREVFLDAQIDALAFYRKLGFQAEGEVFMDAGIPHCHMRLTLSA